MGAPALTKEQKIAQLLAKKNNPEYREKRQACLKKSYEKRKINDCCAEQGCGPQQALQAHLALEGGYIDIASAIASAIARRQCRSGNIRPR